jgi:Copine
MTMTVMEAYDNDMHIPFLGFGGKLPPFYSTSSSCFAVNGNIFRPECEGTQGLLDAYSKGILKI